MRRLLGAVVLAFGVFLLVAAILLPVYVAPALIKVPLNQDSQSVSEATGATVFRIPALKEESGVDLQAIRTVRGDVSSGSDERAVFDVFLYIKDKSGKEVSYSLDRVALDRRTAESVACCRESINGKTAKHKGLIYKFPFNTEKKTYQYYDITALKPYPIEFRGIEQIRGLDVYRFEMTVDPVKIQEREVPGSAVGSTEANVKVDRYYNNTRTLWIEPETGIIIKGQEQQNQTFRDSSGADKVTLLKADIAFTDKTVRKNVDDATTTKRKIGLISRTLPLGLGILGVLLAVGGVALTARSTRAGRRRR